MDPLTDVADDVTRVEAAYRLVHPTLWRALLAYTRDRELASDAEAEAFAQVIHRGDEVRDVAAWVWRSAFAIAAGMLARRARHRPVGSAAGGTARVDGSMAEFLSLLGELSNQQRACIVLRYVTQLDSAGIADALATSEGTVRVQLHRAHETLRRTMKEADHGR